MKQTTAFKAIKDILSDANYNGGEDLSPDDVVQIVQFLSEYAKDGPKVLEAVNNPSGEFANVIKKMKNLPAAWRTERSLLFNAQAAEVTFDPRYGHLPEDRSRDLEIPTSHRSAMRRRMEYEKGAGTWWPVLMRAIAESVEAAQPGDPTKRDQCINSLEDAAAICMLMCRRLRERY